MVIFHGVAGGPESGPIRPRLVFSVLPPVVL